MVIIWVLFPDLHFLKGYFLSFRAHQMSLHADMLVFFSITAQNVDLSHVRSGLEGGPPVRTGQVWPVLSIEAERVQYDPTRPQQLRPYLSFHLATSLAAEECHGYVGDERCVRCIRAVRVGGLVHGCLLETTRDDEAVATH